MELFDEMKGEIEKMKVELIELVYYTKCLTYEEALQTTREDRELLFKTIAKIIKAQNRR